MPLQLAFNAYPAITVGMQTLMRLAVAAFFVALSPFPAGAASRVVTDHADSALYPVAQGIAPGETIWFVFEQALQDGWHVYWKNPGDSGLPLEFVWKLPEGYAAGEIVYPTPERIEIGPLANYGFHGAPVFLVPVTVPESAVVGASIEIALRATWLICEEICVPEEGAFSLTLPVVVTATEDPAAAATAARARAAAPQAYDADARFSIAGDAIAISMRRPDGSLADGYFFPELEGLIEPAASQSLVEADGRLLISMTGGPAAKNAGEAIAGVLALGAGETRRGLSFKAVRSDTAIAAAGSSGAVSEATGGASAPGSGSFPGGLLFLFVSAFLGGALLNLMPCVFPVIFIKAASLMKAAGSNQGALRRDGVIYTAGVIATFAALGGALLALRAGGEQLGWGYQLQSPVVVLLSAYVLFLVGLNLAGVFEVGQSLQGVGGGLARKPGAAGSFFTGVLAVAVAAPCIGPFLTAPIGAAVLLPPALGMLIFIVMALGLAAPYLALSFAPQLAALLPKPGAWMVVFKQALAFPVFAGAAYFLWVLAEQTGSAGLGAALFGAVLLAFAAWMFEQGRNGGARGLLVRGAAVVAAIAALAPTAGLRIVEPQSAATAKHGAIAAIAFDDAAIPALRAEGRGVFVDFTAAWCAICQFNKLTIFSQPELAKSFAANGVSFMVADWTRRDPEITAALARFGANGVPLYVYYPPTGEPTVFPQPLTAGAIIAAIDARP